MKKKEMITTMTRRRGINPFAQEQGGEGTGGGQLGGAGGILSVGGGVHTGVRSSI